MEVILTPAAIDGIQKRLEKGGPGKAMRVYLAGVGCGGGGVASYSAATDTIKEGDTVVEQNGVKIVYDKLLTKHVNHLEIDFVPSEYEDEQIKIKGKFVRG